MSNLSENSTASTEVQTPLLQRRFFKKLNNKGYTIQELLIVMIIIAILFAAGFIGRSIYIERAKMTTLRSDFNNFEYAVQQALLENPTIGRKDVKDQLALLNKYLSEEIKFDNGTDGDLTNLVCKKSDPWDMPYQLWVTPENNANTGNFDEKASPPAVVDNANDAEYRVFIKCYAKNNKSADDAFNLDNDDCVLLIQSVNGDVKTATYGLDKEKGAFTFDSTDTAKTDLQKAYSL